MPYHQFDETDFALDHFFIQWVNHPDAANSLFWETWLQQQHPEKRDTVRQARQLVRLLSHDADGIAQPELQAIWENLPLVVNAKPHSAPAGSLEDILPILAEALSVKITRHDQQLLITR